MKQNPKRSASARRFNTVLIVWLCLTFFFLLFPILGIAIMSFNSSKYGALPFDFTTKWYAELFRSADLISATWYSLWFSLLVSLCAAGARNHGISCAAGGCHASGTGRSRR